MSIQALPYITLLGFLFGSTMVVSRFSVGQFQPLTYVSLRMIIAILACISVYTLSSPHKWPTDRRLWRHAAILGIIGSAVPMTSIVTSLLYQSSGITSVLLTAGPAVTALMAHFVLSDERLNRLKSAGITLALGGAMLLAIRGESGLSDVGRGSLIGYGLVFLAVFCGSAMTIYARKFMRGFPSFQVTSVRLFVAALVLLPLAAITVGFDLQHVNLQGYISLFYAGLVGTFSGFLLAFYNIKNFGATTAAMVLYFIPIFASLGGVLFLDETITTGMLMGTVLIVIGIVIINKGSQELLDTRRKTL